MVRPPAQYRALRDIKVPGSYAFAARAGDDVTETQRINLGLIVGDDPATADITPLTGDAMPRPDDDADRREWQNYAVVRGVSFDEAVQLDRKELIARVGDREPAPGGSVPLRPDPSDKKALWVEHAAHRMVTEHGWDLNAARDRAESATKADLLAAFGPDADEGRRAELVARDDEAADDAGADGPEGQG